MGKAIYQPKGKAKEYSQWACNLYKGCSGDCEYCFMKKGVLGSSWCNPPKLKACFRNEDHAFDVFRHELNRNIDDLRKHGLHFNFSSDPFLKETIELNLRCLKYAAENRVTTRTLTKQTWLIYEFEIPQIIQKNNSFGFTLTGFDELEPGCGPNEGRIYCMQILKNFGYKTWASIEPVIDITTSIHMIDMSAPYCDHYKIGLLSGKKFNQYDIRKFVEYVNTKHYTKKIYWKDGLLKQAGVLRNQLPGNCVTSEFNL